MPLSAERRHLEGDQVRAWLHLPGQRFRMEVELGDLTVHGCSVRLQNESPLHLGVGEELEIGLAHRQLVHEIKLRAMLTARREDIARRHLHLRFLDQDAANGLTHPELARLFNRRTALRVQPPSDTPIAVKVFPPRESGAVFELAPLVDVSTGGLAIDVSIAFERGLRNQDQIEVLFRLPHSEQALSAVARVRHRCLRPDGRVRYGLMFLAVDTLAFRPTYEAILAYVVERQQQLTQEWESCKTQESA
ncbi:MAG: PilZ domain-containing protein [Myxococcales bacterium]|nr:PilZ domain-containing protein [Myxococcales bacterium]